MSPAGGGALVDDASAEAKSADAVAVNPTADNFKKVRLVCSLDMEFSWHESLRGEYSAKVRRVSIVRKYRGHP